MAGGRLSSLWIGFCSSLKTDSSMIASFHLWHEAGYGVALPFAASSRIVKRFQLESCILHASQHHSHSLIL